MSVFCVLVTADAYVFCFDNSTLVCCSCSAASCSGDKCCWVDLYLNFRWIFFKFFYCFSFQSWSFWLILIVSYISSNLFFPSKFFYWFSVSAISLDLLSMVCKLTVTMSFMIFFFKNDCSFLGELLRKFSSWYPMVSSSLNLSLLGITFSAVHFIKYDLWIYLFFLLFCLV